ncbi:MAG TPA: PIN domain-containing protein [Granulicella sp.]
MANIVFDTSVIIALLRGEAITHSNLPHLRWASMSAVNVAEVFTLLADGDALAHASGLQMLSLLRTIEPFTAAQARLVGEFRRLGKNVSLGDRACMALAVDLEADIYTADRAWAAFDIGRPVHLIR